MDKYYLIKAPVECEIWCLDKTDQPIKSECVELTEEELVEIKDCIYTSREVGNQHDTQIDVLEKIGKVLE